MADEFVSGCELSAAFYAEVIRPLLQHRRHAAALLGWGSDVLGVDTTLSTDHGWGPRMHVFVAASDVYPVRRDVEAELPEHFRGWPVQFARNGAATHHVRVTTITEWLHNHLGVDPRAGMRPLDWLVLPQQALLEATGGQVHTDPDAELTHVRTLLSWYPPQVHRWMLACQWERIAQHEAFVGRAAQVGDDLGSRLLTAQLTRDLMRLAFLLTRTLLQERGLRGEIAHKGEKAPIQATRRWHVERTNAWHNAFNRFQRCYERREVVIDAFFDLADAIITVRSLIRQAWTTHRWDTRPRRRP